MEKKTDAQVPFVYPSDEEIFNFKNISKKQLWQEIKAAEKTNLCVSSLRRGLQQESKHKTKQEKEIHDDGKIRKRGNPLCSARDYIWAVEEASKNKFISKLSEEETERIEEEAKREEEESFQHERQIQLHNLAFERFLVEHYEQVSTALQKNDAAAQRLQDQEERLEYFSGLLKAAQTVQEEEQERLQELTAFQHFLAAVTPEQSLKDLLRCLHQKRHEKDEIQGDKGTPGKTSDRSEAPITSQQQEQASTIGTLQSEVTSIRMVNEFPPLRTPEVDDSTTKSELENEALVDDPPPVEGGETAPNNKEKECDFNPHLFDPHLEDPSYLLQLSHMYENQCHALLSLLTRLKQQTEALNIQLKSREDKLQLRLKELERLQESQKNSPTEVHNIAQQSPESEKQTGFGTNLRDTAALIRDWSVMAGDEDAKEQLAVLGKRIGEVVSEVFGSSEFVPLINARLERGAEDEASIESAGLGHGALLTLLEARITDVCSQLDFINKGIRDPIFKRCEHERRALAEEARRQEEEVQRANRRERHLRRALESPPPRRQ